MTNRNGNVGKKVGRTIFCRPMVRFNIPSGFFSCFCNGWRCFCFPKLLCIVVVFFVIIVVDSVIFVIIVVVLVIFLSIYIVPFASRQYRLVVVNS